MAEITEYITGRCTNLACMVQRGAGLRLHRFPARAYSIRVQGALWLWDTGYASHFMEHTAHGIFRMYPKITPVCFDEQDSLVARFARQGIRAEDVSGIILSHFHADHVAGVRDFPRVPLYCSGSGWRQMRKVSGFRALQQGFIPTLLPDDFEHQARFIEDFKECSLPAALLPFTSGRELPGSKGEVLLVELPGHAKGHIGAFVHTASGWVLLAGDAGWTPQNYSELCEPAWPTRIVLDDYARFAETLRRLHELHKRAEVTIMLCHEMP